MSNQNRIQSGVREGGQFATTARSEPSVSLAAYGVAPTFSPDDSPAERIEQIEVADALASRGMSGRLSRSDHQAPAGYAPYALVDAAGATHHVNFNPATSEINLGGGQFTTQARTEAQVSRSGGFSPGEVEQISTKADKDGYQVPARPDFMPEPAQVSWEPVGGSVEVNLYFPDGSFISAWSHDGDLQHTMDASYDIIGGRPKFLTEVSGPERRKREQEAEKYLWALHGRIEAGHLQAEEIAAAKTHDLILSAALGSKEDS